jgi:hypothetical protein
MPRVDAVHGRLLVFAAERVARLRFTLADAAVTLGALLKRHF